MDEFEIPDIDTIVTRFSLDDLTAEEKEAFTFKDGLRDVMNEGFRRFTLEYYGQICDLLNTLESICDELKGIYKNITMSVLG